VPARLVVLASGIGSTLQAVLDATRDPAFGADIVAVGTDRDGARAQERAEAAGIPVFTVRLKDFAERADFDAAVGDAIASYAPDLVVLAGYMKVLGPAVVRRFPIVNTHPSLLPAFPGGHAIADALEYGVKVSGVSVHWVDEGVDTGPVIRAVRVPVEAGDTPETLRARVQAVEHRLLPDVVKELVAA